MKMFWEKLKPYKVGQRVAMAEHPEEPADFDPFLAQKKQDTYFQKLRVTTSNHPKLSAAFIIGCITFAAAMLLTIIILVSDHGQGDSKAAQTATEASKISAESVTLGTSLGPETTEHMSYQVVIECSRFNPGDPGCGVNADCYYFRTDDVYTKGCRCHVVSDF